MKNDDYKHILETLNKLQEAYDNATFCSNAMQIMQVYDNANRLRNYFLFRQYGGWREGLQESIAQCDAICEQCNNAMSALGNKAMQDALMSKWRELAIRMV